MTDYIGIDHIGIAVDDYDAAVSNYRDLLGFPIEREEELPERGLKVCFVDAGNAHLELLGATRDDSEISRFLEKRGSGVHHVCMRVADIETAVRGMRERGARVIGASEDSDGISKGAGGTRVAFVHPQSSHGVLLELAEIPKVK